MKKRLSFFLLLFVAFLDYMGVGLIIPLFATLLFDTNVSILAADTSGPIRGMWMGIMISLGPLFEFFAAPILGSLSDQRGRKEMILFGLSIGCIGYFIGILGVKFSSLWLLILYRALFGISAATMPVIQAAIADMSTPEGKARNFAHYNMALGIGFTLGPFLGGTLSDVGLVAWFSHSTPFLMAFLCTAINLFLLYWKFTETRQFKERSKIEIFRGIRQARVAFVHPTLRIFFLGFFLFVFGWDYFMEFSSVMLTKIYHFSLGQVGNFYAYMGLLYAISTGILIKPFIKRFSTNNLILFSTLASGPYLLLLGTIENPHFFWFYLPPFMILMALFFPVASTYISDHASEDEQGELLGVSHSIQALALILSPMFSGALIGAMPSLVIYLGGFSMLAGGLVFALGRLRERQQAHRFDQGS